jgi:Periplasmic copper-binding protein (NosD)
MRPKLVYFYSFAILWAMLFAPALSFAGATVITSLPYRITESGKYELNADLVANGTDGIEVKVSNVTLDLKGYTLTQSQPGFGGTGFGTLKGDNIVVENGTISGFGTGVLFNGNSNAVEHVRLVGNAAGVSLQGNNVIVQGCFIVGKGTAETSLGVIVSFGSGTEIKDNQISETVYGVFSSTNGACAMIHNYIANSETGLIMSSSTKYQGNVTTNCKTPFKGGIAVGQENG